MDGWERWAGESGPAYTAFALYRDQVDRTGRRSVREVAAHLGKSVSLIGRWQARWSWVERARQYDAHLDAQVRRVHEKAILDYRTRAAQQARWKVQTMMLVDRVIAARLTAVGGDVDAAFLGVSFVGLVSLATASAKVLPALLRAEALALGDVTDRVETPRGDDVLTKRLEASPELRGLAAELIAKAGAALSPANE